jgi:uncharacterized phage-associated protein
MAKYAPASIANGFLELGFRDGIAVDPMKIQKLSFFAQGYYLASTDDPLLNEQFQAWKFGPVLPTIYQRLKRFGGGAITEYAEIYDPILQASRPAAPPEDDPVFVKVRDYVWQTYGKWESTALSRLTHKEGGAWDKTRKANPGIEGPQIANADIRSDFLPLVKKPEPAVA